MSDCYHWNADTNLVITRERQRIKFPILLCVAHLYQCDVVKFIESPNAGDDTRSSVTASDLEFVPVFKHVHVRRDDRRSNGKPATDRQRLSVAINRVDYDNGLLDSLNDFRQFFRTCCLKIERQK